MIITNDNFYKFKRGPRDTVLDFNANGNCSIGYPGAPRSSITVVYRGGPNKLDSFIGSYVELTPRSVFYKNAS